MTRWWQQAWTRWLLFVLCWTAVGLAFAAQLYLARVKSGEPVPWSFAISRSLADWYVFALLSMPALWLARRVPLERTRWRRGLAAHLAASAVFSVAWMVVRTWIELGLNRHATFAAGFTRAFAGTFFLNLLYYWTIISARHAVDYYGKFHERALRAAELETRLTAARLQALQMQLNPHFLFNTLNAISALMRKDIEAADKMIAQLSDLLRYALDSTDEQEVPLRQELHFLDRYLQIQQARFGARLTVRRAIAPETLAARVPNLVLQPLVENALAHGIAPHARPGVLELRAAREGGELRLEVRDNGDGLPAGRPPQEGVGLANTRARLEQLYGAACRFELGNADGGGFVARVSVPWREG